MMLAAPSQVTGVDEMTRHDGPNVNCSSPDVIVLSEDVPSALAVHVPVTWRDPVTGAEGHPAPTNDRSKVPVTLRHDDITAQVPTTLPPQGVTLEQDPPVAPPPELPAVLPPAPLLEVPAAPPAPPPPVPLLQPWVAIADATTITPTSPMSSLRMRSPEGPVA
jgi:hypothetical protein